MRSRERAALLHARARDRSRRRWGLDEIRVNDISTTFTRPKNYIPYIKAGAVFVREKWNTPMSEIYQVNIKDLEPRLTGIQQATFKLYSKRRACLAAS